LKLRKHLQKMASESPQYVSIIERNGNILAAKSKPSFKQTFGVVQDSERYGGSLAVATLSLVNEVKGIFGEAQTIITIYNNFSNLVLIL
jgi:hypothetical protein